MRLYLLLIFIFYSLATNAQSILGKIRDIRTGKLIVNAKVESLNHMTYSNSQGVFNIPIQSPIDTIRISLAGYHTKVIPVDSANHKLMLMVDLEEKAIAIEAIVIEKNTKKADSLQRLTVHIPKDRKMNLNGLIKERASFSDANRSKFLANGSTATLFTINVLALPKLLGFKKEKAPSKEQEINKRQQDMEWVSIFYNVTLIEEITGLKAEQAQLFQNMYAPSAEEIQKMSDYDIRSYISKQYKQYLKENPSGSNRLELKK
ncbi:carboxypeptidase-like regulatory domain-containing protein [Sphingobacterium sp. HJSM2_6]|uniref:carboxypeptidase-like regulatory domain-containing protein n=1 Tax=Sphingobacterium sp. HJSM2_6 TaxID=3366264 RepID=UPI003BD2182E